MNSNNLQKVIREFLSKNRSSFITEANLTPSQLEKREGYIKQLKKNKTQLVKRYGKDAEAVMYGRATNLAKNSTKQMEKQKLKELVRASLMGKTITEFQDIEVGADRYEGEQSLSQASSLLDTLESKLKSHDWWYMMSDDSRAYDKGSQQNQEIKSLIKDLEKIGYGEDAKKLYNEAEPYTDNGIVGNHKLKEDAYELTGSTGGKTVSSFKTSTEANTFKSQNPNIKSIKKLEESPNPLQLKNDLRSLEAERKQVEMDMEQEAEPEGGPISDEYGEILNKLDNKIAKLKSKLNPKSQEKNYDDVKSKIAPQQPAKSKDIYDRLKDMNFLEELTKEGKKEDVTGDGKIDSKDYLAKRNAAIQKAKGKMNEADMFVTGGSINPELRKKVEQFVKGVAKYYDYSVDDAFLAIMTILKGGLNKMNEDLDLGHEDNEPHMLKGDLYRIGKYAMELYQIVDGFEGKGEVDFPAWWQSKITTSMNNMVSAKHYLDFELKEPAIDNMLGVSDNETPMMNEDEIGKADILSGELYKLKGKIQDAYFAKIRKFINMGSYEDAEYLLNRVKGQMNEKGLAETIAKQLKEYSYDDFSGSKLIANTPIPTDINIFKKFFPTGVASMSNAKASLQASDNSGIKDRMGRYAPMFAHVQYHEFEDQTGEKYRAHQTQYYNSNFDKQDPNFNPSVTDLTLFKLASPNGLSKDTNMGSILVKTNDYIKDLDKLNISKRSM
jgi:hypothetical protein